MLCPFGVESYNVQNGEITRRVVLTPVVPATLPTALVVLQTGPSPMPAKSTLPSTKQSQK